MDRDPQELWEEYRAKIAQAREKDFSKRAEAWVQLPHEIAGTIMPPMSLRKLIFLEQIESPLLLGEEANYEDVVTFIWVCSDKFSPEEAKAKAFRKTIRKLPKNLEEEIANYLEDNLSFIRQTSDGGDTSEHFASGVIDLMASQYGWSADTILDLPLPQLFQLLDSITRRLTTQNGGTPITWNPAVDKLKDEYMRQANGRNN